VRIRKIIPVVLLACLALSVTLNVVLARKFSHSYRMFQMVCLDPAGSGAFRTGWRIPDDAHHEPLAILFGDSRIARWRPLPSATGCRVINCGVGGQTSALALLRLERDVLVHHPRVVVVQIGVNDLKLVGVFPERKRAIVDSCWRNIRELVDRTAAENIHVVLLTVFPTGPVGLLRRTVWSEEVVTSIDEVNKKLLELTRPGVTVVDCDPVLAAGEGLRREYVQDTLHLTSSAYEMLNRHLTPILQQLAQAAQTRETNALQ